MSTIGDEMLRAASERVGQLVFHLGTDDRVVTWAELAERASQAATHLVSRGVTPGDRVGLLGRNRPEWAIWAYGVWLAGGALVPLQFPLGVREPDAVRAQIDAVATAAGCRLVVCEPSTEALVSGVTISWQERLSPGSELLPAVSPQNTAVVQFTSGSTARPKGVMLSHAAVLAACRQMRDRLAPDTRGESTLSWVPFFHDLGLFWSLVFPVLHLDLGRLLPTDVFARDPGLWLRLATTTRATQLVGPQSAWSRAFSASGDQSLDLSAVESLRFAAESVDPAFVDRLHAMAPLVKLRPEVVGGSYGLAEATLGVTSSRKGEAIRFHTVDHETLLTQGRAEPVVARSRRVVSCGWPLVGTSVRIVGESGRPLPDDHVGEIQVTGPSLMTGYLGADEPDPFVDGWLRTGDLGYLHCGELYVVGRIKDMMIVLGQNYYPEDFEWAAARVAGVRPGRCVAFADHTRERIVLVVEPAERTDVDRLAAAVRKSVAVGLGAAPTTVQVVAPGTIEKTTSGKLRRAASRSKLTDGDPLFLASSPAVVG